MAYRIFQIDTSIKQTQDSFTRRTGQYFIRKFQEKFGQLEVSYLDLAKNPISFITQDYYVAATTPADMRNASQNDLLKKVNLQQLTESDIYLWDLAGYMYDAPASFKSWLEHTGQFGVTLTEDWHPLLRNKKAAIISAWGGSSDEVSPELGFEASLRKSLKYLGVSDIHFFNIFNTEEITATEDDVQKQINDYIDHLQLN